MERREGKKEGMEIMRKVEKLKVKGKEERKGNRRRQASEQRIRKKE